jgi:phage replication O-like protein O
MIQKPNYTQIPNVYFDSIMQTLNGSENLVFLAIMRKTFGWRKKKDRISYSQIMKMTGLAKSTTASSLKKLEDEGLISAERTGQNITYFVNVEETAVPKIEPVRESNCTENRTGTVPKIEPVEDKTGTKIEHTKESDINKLSKEIYIEIESAYVDAFKLVIPDGEPIIDYKKIRSREKAVLSRLPKEKILQVIESAKKDQWIIDNGFSLLNILSDYQLNKLLNGRPSKPYSKPVRNLSPDFEMPDNMDVMPEDMK